MTVVNIETGNYIYIEDTKFILCSVDRASYNMAIIIQQDAKEYSLFKSVNCSTCFGWYFTHPQELITLYLQHLTLMRPLLLPALNVQDR